MQLSPQSSLLQLEYRSGINQILLYPLYRLEFATKSEVVSVPP